MKMFPAGSAAISDYASYSKNCNPSQCNRPYFVPVPALADVQLYIRFGASAPGSVSFTMLDLCTPSNTASLTSDCFIIAFSGVYYYGVFKNFSSSANYASYIIAASAGGVTYFSEQYRNAEPCESITKVQVCYPFNYDGEDVNGIYIGEPDPAGSVSGIATMFYQHIYWVRDAEIIGTQNKITFTSNGKKNFSSKVNKLSEFRPEAVPGYYKDCLLAAYFRGNITINDVEYLVSDLAFENINEGADLWKAYAVLNTEIKGAFGCAPFVCPVDDCTPPPPPVCVPVSIVGSPSMPDAVSGEAYNFSISLAGTSPYTLSATMTKPTWMSIGHSGSSVTFSGTPTDSDLTDGPIPISITVTNACGSVPFTDNIQVLASSGGPGTRTLRFTVTNFSGVQIQVNLNAAIDVDIDVTQAFADGFTGDVCDTSPIASVQLHDKLIAAGSTNTNDSQSPTGDWTTVNSYTLYNVIINNVPRFPGDVIPMGSYNVTVIFDGC